jgi:diguanylate cyclase (GGDEF)-like protein
MSLSYTTLFFCDVVTGSVYALAMAVLAVRTPGFRGHRWFTAGVVLGLLRNILLGTLGYLPLSVSLLLASLCNIWCFFCLYMGYRWVTMRRPLQSRRWPLVLAIESALFVLLFLAGMPHTFPLSIGPIFILCVISIRMLLKNRDPDTRGASIAGIVVLSAHLLIISVRTPYILLHYDQNTKPGMAPAQSDPIWLLSMAALMLVSAFFFLVYLWFFELELHRALRQQVRTDARTGALNVRALEDDAEREMARASRKELPLSVIAIDLDHFKALNDRHGHAAGDEALRQVVRAVRAEMRAGDVVARTGGEEFIVLLPETKIDTAEEIAERLRVRIEGLAVEFEGETITMTVSAGLSAYLGEGDAWPLLLRRADQALYEAKRTGRNRVAVSLTKNWAPTEIQQAV